MAAELVRAKAGLRKAGLGREGASHREGHSQPWLSSPASRMWMGRGGGRPGSCLGTLAALGSLVSTCGLRDAHRSQKKSWDRG